MADKSKKIDPFREEELVISGEQEAALAEKNQKRWAFWLDVGLTVLIILCCFFIVVQFVGKRVTVSGKSMSPTLTEGDSLYCDRLTYRFSKPERFDIVFIDMSSQEGVYYVKRIIGLPGETVQIKGGYVYIDGVQLKEDVYGKDLMSIAGRASQPITLGENEYFVLGDNRNDSEDSRSYKVGNVHIKQIVGKSSFRIFPLSAMGKIE